MLNAELDIVYDSDFVCLSAYHKKYCKNTEPDDWCLDRVLRNQCIVDNATFIQICRKACDLCPMFLIPRHKKGR